MEIYSAWLAFCAGNSLVTGEPPSQRPVTLSFDVFFHLCLNKRLSKQSWGWRFETPSHSLWRHWNGTSLILTANLCKKIWLIVPSYVICCRKTLSSLVEVMGWRLFDVKPLPESTMTPGTNLIEIWIRRKSVIFIKTHLRMSSAKWRSFRLEINVWQQVRTDRMLLLRAVGSICRERRFICLVALYLISGESLSVMNRFSNGWFVLIIVCDITRLRKEILMNRVYSLRWCVMINKIN